MEIGVNGKTAPGTRNIGGGHKGRSHADALPFHIIRVWEENQVKHVFLYIRVSTEEQAIHGLSIEAQTAALEEWTRANGYKAVDTYIDAGISARKPASKRPELQRLLTDVKAGKGEMVVFTKLTDGSATSPSITRSRRSWSGTT